MKYWIVSVYVPSFTTHWIRKAYLDRKSALCIAWETARMYPSMKVYVKKVSLYG